MRRIAKTTTQFVGLIACRGWNRCVVAATLAMIRLYQRFISPYKGFRCAYRVHTRRASCSQLGYRAIRRHGLLRGMGVLRLRFDQCAFKHRKYSPQRHPHPLQAGFCDLDCGFVDADCANGACNALNCCSLPDDCGGRRSKDLKKERGVRYEMSK